MNDEINQIMGYLIICSLLLIAGWLNQCDLEWFAYVTNLKK
jgi:hypothetical protein